MTVDDRPPESSEPRLAAASLHAGPATHGFLFADLRGYTSFVATEGAASAVDLLIRYRALVRDAIARFEGAEIRTEGDSFYVVFASVSAAVRCGLTIVEAATTASAERTDLPIRVGIGIHAGETIETADGFVGSPVNIAARICSVAAGGEVLVSDTVRALTETLLPVRFVSRRRRHLKGVPEPIALFAVVPIPAADGTWSRGRARRWWGSGRWWYAAAGTTVALGVVAVGWFAMRAFAPAELPPGPWKIGVSLPLSGDIAPVAEPLRLAVELAVNEANADGGIGGAQLELDARDNAAWRDVPEDPSIGAANAAALVADPRVVAMVGPFYSEVAEAQIPITNVAGLLHCGPASTDPGLTKPGAGALELRSAYPARINYVRVPALADVEAQGAASFAVNDLGARSALVIDDSDVIGRSVADAFEEAFVDLGGQVVRRALNPGADPLTVLEPLNGPGAPTLVYFGGFPFSGAPEVRRAMVDAGHESVTFMSWEGILDYIEPSSPYVDQAGEAAVGTYASQPSVGTVRADFEQRFRTAYDIVPDGPLLQYVASAYACTELILETLRRVAEDRPTAEGLREAVRSYAVDSTHRFHTVVGEVSFDANGDNAHQFVTIYRAVASVPGDSGNWLIVKQLDFGPAP